MTDTDTVVISDPYRQPITVQRHRTNNGVVIRTAGAWIILSEAECDRLIGFIRNEPTIQRYPVAARDRTLTDSLTPSG